jgi:undecaprenyl-diphosphatase
MPFIDTLLRVDTATLYAINHAHHPALDMLFATLSNSEFFYPILLIIVLILIIKEKRKALHLLVLTLLTLLILDKAFVWTLKPLVNRPRPHEVLPHIRSAILDLPRIPLYGKKTLALPIPSPAYLRIDTSPADQAEKTPPAKGRSFISGHAANNLTIAILTTAFYPSLAVPAFTWVILISYSRVYTGAHYPSDILIAWLLAAAVSLLMLRLYRRYFGLTNDYSSAEVTKIP